ncbi:MAG TPA: ATP-binding protein [Metabacillus sp.]|nr:ATP-binding protein [Metabacillus sp.]
MKSDHKFTLFISLMLVFSFVFIRQIFTLLENNKILTEIETLNQSLEKKVMFRTFELEEKNRQLFDLNETLEESVNQRTMELTYAQNQLSESKQLYQSLFKHHPDLIVTYNLSGDFIQYNKKIDYQTLRLVKEIIYDIGIGYFDRALNGETESIEKSYYNEQGDLVHFHVTLIPMRVNNELKGAFGIFHDITEQKKVEELLKKSEMITAMGYLAAGVAHEVRNPLTSIKGFLQLMNWDDSNSKYKDIIFTELNQVEYVINEYLALSKPKENVLEFVDIHQLIVKISRVMETNSILKGINIEVKSEGRIPLIYCVEKELSQVFVNIIKNAIEASNINSKIEIFLSSLSVRDVQIIIKDNGVGIPTERLKKLGQPYYSNKEKGTGLGWMFCYKIIQEQKGFIQFESEEGKGTSVFITLPVTPKMLD